MYICTKRFANKFILKIPHPKNPKPKTQNPKTKKKTILKLKEECFLCTNNTENDYPE